MDILWNANVFCNDTGVHKDLIWDLFFNVDHANF